MVVLTRQQNAKASIAKPAALASKRAQSLSQGLVTASLLFILKRGAIQSSHAARPTFADVMVLHRLNHSPALHIGR